MIYGPRRRCRFCLGLAFVISVSGCESDNRIYTLYRSSIDDSAARVHVATFDADNERYNQAVCEQGRGYFQADNDAIVRDRPNIAVKIRYWCEKGRYRE